MSGALPTEQQLARIHRGVMGRIDARRRLARQVVGSAVAVLVIGGGVGLLAASVSRSSAGSGAASGSGGGSSASLVVVRCHEDAAVDSPATAAKADVDDLPRSAIEACARTVDLQSGTGTTPSASRSAPPTARPTGRPALRSGAAVCRGPAGIEVFPTDRSPASLCRANGLRVVQR